MIEKCQKEERHFQVLTIHIGADKQLKILNKKHLPYHVEHIDTTSDLMDHVMLWEKNTFLMSSEAKKLVCSARLLKEVESSGPSFKTGRKGSCSDSDWEEGQ